jgi:ElaB/YqjD/DUF883 family membrane-anchored ribosome-binding protein
MRDNFTGIQPAEGNQPAWSPANSSLGQGDTPFTPRGDTMQESGNQSGDPQEYKEKIMGAVSQAKDYLGEKAGVVSDKIKEFATDDLSGMANKAKDFARQNPGQAILISAGAGLLLGLIVRGRR